MLGINLSMLPFTSLKPNVFEDRGSEIVIDKKKLIYLVRYYFDRIIPFCHDKMGCQNDTKVDRHKIISATTLCIMLYQPVSVSGDGDNNLQLQTIINAEFARFFGSYVLKLSWRKNSANNLKAPGNEIRNDALGQLWPEYLKYLLQCIWIYERKNQNLFFRISDIKRYRIYLYTHFSNRFPLEYD